MQYHPTQMSIIGIGSKGSRYVIGRNFHLYQIAVLLKIRKRIHILEDSITDYVYLVYGFGVLLYEPACASIAT